MERRTSVSVCFLHTVRRCSWTKSIRILLKICLPHPNQPVHNRTPPLPSRHKIIAPPPLPSDLSFYKTSTTLPPIIPPRTRSKIRLNNLPPSLPLLNRKLRQQRQMITRVMPAREPGARRQIPFIDLAQQPIDAHMRRRVPDIVNHALEARGVVREREVLGAVCTLEAERVRHAITCEGAIAEGAEVGVVWGEGAVGEEFVDAGVREGVCVDADEEGDLGAGGVFLAWLWFGEGFCRGAFGLDGVAVFVDGGVAFGEAEELLVFAGRELGVLLGDLGELFEEDGDLNHFDVFVGGVPVTVSVGD